ncbi:MAG: DUF6152 family protein [Steroidobacteraceae bacterium]
MARRIPTRHLMNKYLRVLVPIAAALMIAVPAVAHHSGAMFNDKEATTLAGTVKAFQWTNPHCWIQLVVVSLSGPKEWSVQMGSPSQLYRGGWRSVTLKPGDKITVVVHPMRDGTAGGLFISAVASDGTPLGKH